MNEKLKKKILTEMESIIGNSCYNGNIQNWGAGGYWEGEGRNFRYPITFFDKENVKRKCYRIDSAFMSMEQMRTGYYAFGANQLHIIQALEAVLKKLKEDYGFNPQEKSNVIMLSEKQLIEKSSITKQGDPKTSPTPKPATIGAVLHAAFNIRTNNGKKEEVELLKQLQDYMWVNQIPRWYFSQEDWDRLSPEAHQFLV